MMNPRLKQLMLRAGYAAPELAGRAINLSELIIQECISLLPDDCRAKNGCHTSWVIKDHFKDKTSLKGKSCDLIVVDEVATLAVIEGRCHKAVLAKKNKRYNGAMPK